MQTKNEIIGEKFDIIHYISMMACMTDPDPHKYGINMILNCSWARKITPILILILRQRLDHVFKPYIFCVEKAKFPQKFWFNEKQKN